MRIVLISNYYSPLTGYAENCLPAALAALGHEVQVVTSTLKPYGLSSFYSDVYERFLGPPVVEPTTFEDRGIPITRLPYFRLRDRIGLRGLAPTLRSIRPDVVEVFDYPSMTALQAVLASQPRRFKLFTAAHIPISVFPPAQSPKLGVVDRVKLKLLTWLPGRLVSFVSQKTYAVTEDAAYVAVRFLGVQKKKVEQMSLGVDTSLFHPGQTDAELDGRDRIRAEFGVADDEVVAVYTGRLTQAKDPLLLAHAIENLRRAGHRYAGLFIGEGEQAKAISACEGSTILPFIEFSRLGPYYRAADVGVWPREESTSMLDAAACGIPIVVSNRIKIKHTIEGNGLTYKVGDVGDLERVLIELIEEGFRSTLGAIGAERMRSLFSWDEIAQRRAGDYARALANR